MDVGRGLRMPLRFLRGSSGRLLLTVIALASGVALVAAVDLVNRAVLRAFVEVVDTMAGRAALQVSAGEGALFPEGLARTVGEIPGVELAVPSVSATAFTTDGSGELLTVQGVDITDETTVRIYEARDAGGIELDEPLVFLSRPDSIVVTRTFAGRHGLATGDPLVLETPTGRHAFTIRGLLEPEGVARVYGGNLVVMDLFAAEAMFARPGFVNRLDVVVKRDADVATVAAAITRVLPGGLHVTEPAQRKAEIHRIMQSLQILLRGVSLLGLIAAFLIAFNRLATVFEARAWQIGVLRAVGLPVRSVWWELVKESLVLGVVGVLLGVPLGIGLGRLLLPVIAATTALNFKLIAPEAEMLVAPEALVLAGVLGLAAALLAASLPAWRAARLEVVETLRTRGREQPGGAAGVGHAWRAGVALSIAAAIGVHLATGSPAWGLAASGLVAVGTALAARPLVTALSGLVVAGLCAVAGPTGRLATTVITQNPRRTALSVAMLGVGLGAVIWVWTVAYSFERSVVDTLARAMRADLNVSSMYVSSGSMEAPVDDRLVDELAAIAGVTAVAGERAVDWHYADGPIAINAIDPLYFHDADFGQWPLHGPHRPDAWGAVAAGRGVVVSSNFVLNLGTAVGDTITLETPGGPLPLEVVGVTMDFLSARGTIKLSREVYADLWNDHQLTHAFVQLDPTADQATVRATIARELGRRYGLRILSSGELRQYFAGQVRRAFAPGHVLTGLVLLVVLFGVADTLGAGIADRTRELGAVRAIGVERRQLRRMVMLEGLALGTLGLVLAIVSGVALGVLWVKATFPFVLGWVLTLVIPWERMGLVAVTAIVVSLVAGVLPARRAAHLEPAAALRYE